VNLLGGEARGEGWRAATADTAGVEAEAGGQGLGLLEEPVGVEFTGLLVDLAQQLSA
jgi:hypothetical protein